MRQKLRIRPPFPVKLRNRTNFSSVCKVQIPRRFFRTRNQILEFQEFLKSSLTIKTVENTIFNIEKMFEMSLHQDSAFQ